MYCPECGHQNPIGNKFCGMCGDRLPDKSAQPERRSPERQERIAEHDPEPVAASLRHREPVDETIHDEPIPPAVANFYAARPQTEEPVEETTVSGPSFLGLSGGSGSSPGYSYLYEDEPSSSHGGLVFLLILAILGGVVYWKWQPLRDYVVNAAMNHSQTGRAPEAAPTQPGSTTASSDNTAPQPGQAANPNGLPQQDNATTPNEQPKVETAQPKGTKDKKDEAAPQKSEPEKSSVPRDERPQSEVGRTSRFQDVKSKNASDEDSAEDSEKPTASRPAKAAGAELVDTGERYLYGRGVARSCGQALSNFQSAAKQDNPRAMSHLGSLYATGQCVPLDRVQAYQWFSRALAADRSNTYLEHNLNMLWRDMSSDERAKATQKRMF